MKIRTIIVDDEPLARKRVKNLLTEDQDFDIISECKNGIEAVKIIKSEKPDLIFLDIQMPGLDGFSVISDMSKTDMPLVVFITAYKDYAIKAFDVKANDYLLKPFDDERFFESLDRIKEIYLSKRKLVLNDKLTELINDFKHESSEYLGKIELKENGLTLAIACKDVFYFESEGNYVKLVCKANTHLFRKTMNLLEDELDPKLFLRIHRKIIINKNFVEKLKYLAVNNEFEFRLMNGSTVRSSRTYKTAIQKHFK